jgi:Na+-transporting methylmalonyl-CoA/oxaloacetate decarboxylase gamma subunit
MIYEGSVIISKLVLNIFVLGIGVFFSLLSIFILLCLIHVIRGELRRVYGRTSNNKTTV